MKSEEASNEINSILNKYNLKIGYEVAFPLYKSLPEEVKLALLVLSKHEMKIIMVLKDK